MWFSLCGLGLASPAAVRGHGRSALWFSLSALGCGLVCGLDFCLDASLFLHLSLSFSIYPLSLLLYLSIYLSISRSRARAFRPEGEEGEEGEREGWVHIDRCSTCTVYVEERERERGKPSSYEEELCTRVPAQKKNVELHNQRSSTWST